MKVVHVIADWAVNGRSWRQETWTLHIKDTVASQVSENSETSGTKDSTGRPKFPSLACEGINVQGFLCPGSLPGSTQLKLLFCSCIRIKLLHGPRCLRLLNKTQGPARKEMWSACVSVVCAGRQQGIQWQHWSCLLQRASAPAQVVVSVTVIVAPGWSDMESPLIPSSGGGDRRYTSG